MVSRLHPRPLFATIQARENPLLPWNIAIVSTRTHIIQHTGNIQTSILALPVLCTRGMNTNTRTRSLKVTQNGNLYARAPGDVFNDPTPTISIPVRHNTEIQELEDMARKSQTIQNQDPAFQAELKTAIELMKELLAKASAPAAVEPAPRAARGSLAPSAEQLVAKLKTPRRAAELAKELGMDKDELSKELVRLARARKIYHVHGDTWVRVIGDKTPTRELMEHIEGCISHAPMTFKELKQATGARPGRVSGCLIRLKHRLDDEGKRAINDGGSPRRARWTIPTEDK